MSRAAPVTPGGLGPGRCRGVLVLGVNREAMQRVCKSFPRRSSGEPRGAGATEREHCDLREAFGNSPTADSGGPYPGEPYSLTVRFRPSWITKEPPAIPVAVLCAQAGRQ